MIATKSQAEVAVASAPELANDSPTAFVLVPLSFLAFASEPAFANVAWRSPRLALATELASVVGVVVGVGIQCPTAPESPESLHPAVLKWAHRRILRP